MGIQAALRGAPPWCCLSKHPPDEERALPLAGTTILVDPGHGGEELGARGPDGTPEKAVNLDVSLLLQEALESRGATVIMTRTDDSASGPNERADQINRDEPTLALSIHYNALPDNGDALNTAGIGAFLVPCPGSRPGPVPPRLSGHRAGSAQLRRLLE